MDNYSKKYFLFWLVSWFILIFSTITHFQKLQVENTDINRILVLHRAQLEEDFQK